MSFMLTNDNRKMGDQGHCQCPSSDCLSLRFSRSRAVYHCDKDQTVFRTVVCVCVVVFLKDLFRINFMIKSKQCG